jgi:hypothetical protein
MRSAKEISAVRSPGFGAFAVLALAVVLLLSPALVRFAVAGPVSLEATRSREADRPATTDTAKAVTSTSRPPAGRASASWSPVLPLVLAAILVLAVLDPPSGFHLHQHWHRY